jgi:hypothetical protein
MEKHLRVGGTRSGGSRVVKVGGAASGRSGTIGARLVEVRSASEATAYLQADPMPLGRAVA